MGISKMIPEKMNLFILLKIILEQYFENESCVLMINDQNNTLKYSGQHQIITISFDSFNNLSNIIEESIFGFDYGCKGFVIDTSKYASMFELIEDKIRHSFVRHNTRKYLFIVEENFENYEKKFRNISGLQFISNVLFISEKTPEMFLFWWYDYSRSDKEIIFEIADTWFARNRTFLVGVDLYPDKLRNQKKRDLKMACFSYPPYTNCDQLDENYGTEVNLVLEFARVYNLTPKVVQLRDDALWGTMNPNWTGTGIMGLLVDDKADIAFTALYVWEFVYQYMDPSTPYTRGGITCLVPKPKRLNGLLTPVLSYKPSLWLVVISNYVVNALFLFLVLMCSQCKKKRNSGLKMKSPHALLDSFWTMMLISLEQTIHSKHNSHISVVKIVLGILFLAYLVLNSTYFSGLASIMTVPRYEDPIDTIEDLANSKVEILGFFSDWIRSIKDIDEKSYKKIVEHFKTVPKDKLRGLSQQDDNAFFMERLPYNNYGINDFIKSDVIENYHLMKEDVYWEYTVFYLRKSSILTPSFDIFILKVLESGLPSYWQQQAVYRFMDAGVQRRAIILDKYKSNQEKAIKLEMSHIVGCIALLFIGYSLSAIAYITEILISYRKKRERYITFRGIHRF